MILNHNGQTVCTGRLAKDATFRVSGAKEYHFCDFSIPADEYQTEAGDKRTTWVNVSCAFELADAARNLRKGDRVLVCGKMRTRSYTANTGEEKKRTELYADFFLRMGEAPAAPQLDIDDLANSFPQAVQFAEAGDGEGDLPF